MALEQNRLPFQLRNRNAVILLNDTLSLSDAVARTTDIAVVAHPEDLGRVGLPGIQECYGDATRWFSGIVCGDGLKSPPAPSYQRTTRRELQTLRARELHNASQLGQCALVLHLNYPARLLREARHVGVIDDLIEVITAIRPHNVFTHNPVEEDETWLGIFVSTVQAVRGVHPGRRPRKLYACETGLGLDWLPETDRISFDVSERSHVADSMMACFDSILAGGDAIDRAHRSRREATALLHPDKHHPAATQLLNALDVTRLIMELDLGPEDYLTGLLNRFRDQMLTRIARRLGTAEIGPASPAPMARP